MKVVVVGASSGLGRCIGIGLGQRGEQVALLARRKERLLDAARDAGPGTLAIECDATDMGSCQDAIGEAAETMGGIDALVYATGIGMLARIEDLTTDQWRQLFDTNVIGAAHATAAALPYLKASDGSAAYLSSVASNFTPPWPGLGGYAVSKAALDTLVEAWRAEHPEIAFTRVIVGDCSGGEGDNMTQFNQGWDMELAAEFAPTWVERRYIAGNLMDVEELVRVVDTVLRCGVTASIPTVAVTPRPAR